MLASYDWRVRHAGLMAIAAIGEGTGKVRPSVGLCLYDSSADDALVVNIKVMQNELGKIVECVYMLILLLPLNNRFPRSLVTPMFADSHPRVRYAACQCV